MSAGTPDVRRERPTSAKLQTIILTRDSDIYVTIVKYKNLYNNGGNNFIEIIINLTSSYYIMQYIFAKQEITCCSNIIQNLIQTPSNIYLSSC